MQHHNVYTDAHRAAAYARLEFPGTYYLAYRDLPELIRRYSKGHLALDFGCGTGRSTRFLKKIGLTTVGVDIASAMVAPAREADPQGEYHVTRDGDLGVLSPRSFDLALSAFTFDNMPSEGIKLRNLKAIRGLLHRTGVIINLVSSPDIYTHEWASFTTAEFPENRCARSGDPVRIIMKDVEDKRPVEDTLCTDETYRDLYERAGLRVLEIANPLARNDEPYDWISETTVAPWTIYVLEPG